MTRVLSSLPHLQAGPGPLGNNTPLSDDQQLGAQRAAVPFVQTDPDDAAQIMAASAPPTMPHQEKTSLSGITYEQAWAGCQQAYKRARVYETWWNQIVAIMVGQGGFIAECPTGKEDDDGNLIVVEWDLADMLEKMAPERRASWLAEISNYACAEFERYIALLAKYSDTVFRMLGNK